MEGGVEAGQEAAAATAAAVQFREGSFRLHTPRPGKERGKVKVVNRRRRPSKGRGSRKANIRKAEKGSGRHVGRSHFPLPPPRPSKVGANARLNLV